MPSSHEDNRSFWEHVEDLRKTLLKMLLACGCGVFLSFVFYDKLFSLLLYPIHTLPVKVVILGPIEGFSAALKMSVWVGTALTSPLWGWFLLQFLLPALKKEEKNLLPLFMSTLFGFFILGALFAYFITLPLASKYLLSFNTPLGENLWSLGNYMDYTALLLLASGLSFEVFSFLVCGAYLGVIQPEWLAHYRRGFVVFAFILGAIVTPPDVLTQLLVAVPLVILYELCFWVLKVRNQVLGI